MQNLIRNRRLIAGLALALIARTIVLILAYAGTDHGGGGGTGPLAGFNQTERTR
jgi:hypothetical protein